MNAEDLLKDIPLDIPDEQHDLQQESKRERISAITAGVGSVGNIWGVSCNSQTSIE